jgi:hypothetical protein
MWEGRKKPSGDETLEPSSVQHYQLKYKRKVENKNEMGPV